MVRADRTLEAWSMKAITMVRPASSQTKAQIFIKGELGQANSNRKCRIEESDKRF